MLILNLDRYNVTNEAVIQTIKQNTLPLFFDILKGDVAEFSPYVFQLLAQILESQSSLTPPFDSLLSPILAPAFWSMRGKKRTECTVLTVRQYTSSR